MEREGGSESPIKRGNVLTLLETHNTTRNAQLLEEQSTWMWQSQHTREDNMYNTQQRSPRKCDGHYNKFMGKFLSDAW